MGGILGIVNAIGNAVKFVAKPLLVVANRLPPGAMTGTGAVAAVAGAALSAASGHIVTSQNIVDVINACGNVVAALGTVVAAFGAQRAHTAPPTPPAP